MELTTIKVGESLQISMGINLHLKSTDGEVAIFEQQVAASRDPAIYRVRHHMNLRDVIEGAPSRVLFEVEREYASFGRIVVERQ